VRGVLITIEGVEGSGKSTQARRLGAHLVRRGLDVVQTSEPDGTPLGAAVRQLFAAPGLAPTPLGQAFLFLAARQQHVTQIIRPALQRGAVVCSDRYTDATLAYQGYGQGVDVETLRELNTLATGGILPDLTLVLDLDPVVGMARIGGRPRDVFERMDLAFHRRVREGYLEIARADKRRVRVLPAEQAEAGLHAEVTRVVDEFLAHTEAARGV
jgi:dTMP kinase